MLTAENIILTLKLAVMAVTILFLSSILALLRKNYRLHGRINLVFFILTITALLGLELIVRVIDPHLVPDFLERTGAGPVMTIHLCFALPAATILPLMLWTGLRHQRLMHVTLAGIFVLLWTGTFITGVFFLPHQAP